MRWNLLLCVFGWHAWMREFFTLPSQVWRRECSRCGHAQECEVDYDDWRDV